MLTAALQGVGIACAVAGSDARVTASSVAFMCGAESFVADWRAKFAAKAKPFNDWAAAKGVAPVPEAADALIHTGYGITRWRSVCVSSSGG